MSTEIIVALLSLLGTAIGSLAGIMAANKLVVYRIEQLEKKVEKPFVKLHKIPSEKRNFL